MGAYYAPTGTIRESSEFSAALSTFPAEQKTQIELNLNLIIMLANAINSDAFARTHQTHTAHSAQCGILHPEIDKAQNRRHPLNLSKKFSVAYNEHNALIVFRVLRALHTPSRVLIATTFAPLFRNQRSRK